MTKSKFDAFLVDKNIAHFECLHGTYFLYKSVQNQNLRQEKTE